MLLPFVALAVIFVVPKLTGSWSDQLPLLSAVVEPIGTVPPVGGAASTSTRARAVVVPVTVTVEPVTLDPSDGEPIVIGSVPACHG